MGRALSERWLLVLSLGLAGCGTERVIYHQVVPPPDTAITVTVTPKAVNVNCGQTVSLFATVTANAGVSRSVRWGTLNADVADVDSAGLVHAYGPGNTTITATSVADPSKAGLASVTVAAELLPSITISQVLEAGTGQPANLNAVTDSIDVTYNLDGGGGACIRGALPWVSVTARLTNGQDSLTATLPVPSSATSFIQVKIRLNTAAKRADGTPVLPNGAYALTGVVLGSNGTRVQSSNTVQLTVAN